MIKIWFLSLLISPFLLASQTTRMDEWFEIENSEITILGTSNVTDYSCLLRTSSENQHLLIESATKGLTITLKDAVIKLKANDFVCDNGPMTKDFLKTIKAEKYPHVLIEFQSFQLNEPVEKNNAQQNVISTIAVTLAGVQRFYKLRLDSLNFEMDSVTVSGQKELNISDFQIQAPTALFGLVRADDKVTIEFKIVFKRK